MRIKDKLTGEIYESLREEYAPLLETMVYDFGDEFILTGKFIETHSGIYENLDKLNDNERIEIEEKSRNSICANCGHTKSWHCGFRSSDARFVTCQHDCKCQEFVWI